MPSSNHPNAAGPLGDYATVHANTTEGFNWLNALLVDNYTSERGPFRSAIHSISGTEISWQPRDSFARVSDGLSNQFFIGEKHIPLGRVGKCPNKNYANTGTIYRDMGDCSILKTGWRNSVSGSRAMVYYENDLGGASNGVQVIPISPANLYAEDNVPIHTAFHCPVRGMAFGSYHPGICHFLLGDGSVRGVAVTTGLSVLQAFAMVDDGEPVSLP